MKNLVVNGGKFTTAGNFSGYTALGERVHVYGRQMEAIGATEKDITFPLFVISEIKKIGQLNEAGEPMIDAVTKVPVTVDRLTALSVFKTKDELIKAHTDCALIDAEIQVAVNTAATTAGLTKEQLANLANASL